MSCCTKETLVSNKIEVGTVRCISKVIGRVISVTLCAAIILTAIPLTSFAGEVDYNTAADPAAILAKIEAMNLPDMPDRLAEELRGGAGGWDLLYGLGTGAICAYITSGTGAGFVCGATATIASYLNANRVSIAKLVAYSGGKMVKQTTACAIIKGVRYYC
jgi:hypothetical protein